MLAPPNSPPRFMYPSATISPPPIIRVAMIKLKRVLCWAFLFMVCLGG